MPENVNVSALGLSFDGEEENDDREVMIDVDHVSMVFNMASESLGSLKEYFIKLAKRELFFEEFVALDDVSFKVRKGDVYGIMGTNGSGKSTLLKIIAGVLDPTKGSCSIHGNIAPLIELGAGFDTELSARENIYLNGALLGYSKSFLDEHFDDIVAFAEIEKFLDMPLKNYSSGMVSRIAFAIATVIVPEILLVDEVLSVGDFMFQKKCERRIAELIERYGVTVLIVSHSNEQVARLCNKAIWIEKGHVRCMGPANEISHVYGTLGGRIGSPENEKRVCEAMIAAKQASLSLPPASIDCSTNAEAAVQLAHRGWTEKPDTIILADPSAHIAGVLAAPLSHLLNAPVVVWDFSRPAPETQYYLQSVLPKRVIAIRLSKPAAMEPPLGNSFDWAPELYEVHDDYLPNVVSEIYELGRKLGTWSKDATIVDFGDNMLSMAIAAQCAKTNSPLFTGLDTTESLPEETAKKLAADGFESVTICGPTFPEEQIALFEQAGLTVRRVARNNDDGFYLYNQIVENMGPGGFPNIHEAMVDAYTGGVWLNLIAAPAYLAHVDGALFLEDVTNLDAMVAVLDGLNKATAANKLSVIRTSNGLSNDDVNLLASQLGGNSEES